MNDAKILDELKDELKSAKTTPSSKNGKRQTSGDSAKAGANRIAQFINDVSDKASDQVADAITAAVVHKSMQKLGIGNGPLTEMAISQFDAAFTEVLVVQLPYLTGADGGEQSEFFLPPASNGVGKNFN